MLSAQNDVYFGCENIASGSNFLLAYKTKVHVFKFIYHNLILKLNLKMKPNKTDLFKDKT